MNFDPRAVLAQFRRDEVIFVVIGGVAATLHGSPYPTSDLDICPQQDERNLERLARSLNALGAKKWDPRKDIEVSIEWSKDTLEVDKTWILTTRFGHVDVRFQPAGTQGYRDLARQKVHYDLNGVSIEVADLEDLIRMKEAAGRERDLEHLPTLRKLLERRSLESD